MATGLAVVNHELARPPIEVAQLQCGHFASPQAEPGEQDEDRPVAPADQRLGVAASDQQSHRTGAECPGQAARSPMSDRRHRRGQLPACVAGQEQKTEQRPKPSDEVPRRGASPPATLANYVLSDRRRRQLAQLKHARMLARREEFPAQPRVLAHHGGRQRPLAEEVATILLHHQIRLAGDQDTRRRRHPQGAQVPHQRHHCSYR